MTVKRRLVILISGGGSNLQAFINACNNRMLNAEIALVISNKANAYGLERAAQANVPTLIIDHHAFTSREAFDAELLQQIDARQPDLVILAGFMRILTEGFVNHFKGRLINIHPSLLPKYPGLNTHRRALEAGDTEAGVTVHFVTEELDGGPAVIQAKVPIEKGDNEDSLAKRVLTQEHIIYPLAVQWYCEGRLVLENDQSILDGKHLPATGFAYNEINNC